jgi:hypothetical protein
MAIVERKPPYDSDTQPVEYDEWLNSVPIFQDWKKITNEQLEGYAKRLDFLGIDIILYIWDGCWVYDFEKKSQGASNED